MCRYPDQILLESYEHSGIFHSLFRLAEDPRPNPALPVILQLLRLTVRRELSGQDEEFRQSFQRKSEILQAGHVAPTPHRRNECIIKISTILDHTDSGHMALLEFQRGYVWYRDQARSLFDSHYRRHPVGGLLVWAT